MSIDNLAAVEIPEAPGGNVGSNPWPDLLRMGQGVKENILDRENSQIKA